jgi:hypothetical protein
MLVIKQPSDIHLNFFFRRLFRFILGSAEKRFKFTMDAFRAVNAALGAFTRGGRALGALAPTLKRPAAKAA